MEQESTIVGSSVSRVNLQSSGALPRRAMPFPNIFEFPSASDLPPFDAHKESRILNARDRVSTIAALHGNESIAVRFEPSYRISVMSTRSSPSTVHEYHTEVPIRAIVTLSKSLFIQFLRICPSTCSSSPQEGYPPWNMWAWPLISRESMKTV